MEEALASLQAARSGNDHDGTPSSSSSTTFGGGGADAAVAASAYYDMDPMEWAEQEFRDTVNMSTTSTTGTGATTPRGGAYTTTMATPLKRTPLLERADTPIMSNSRNSGGGGRGGRRGSTISFKDNDEDEDGSYMPMETPLQRRFQTTGGSTLAAGGGTINKTWAGSARSSSSSSPPPSRPALNQNTFRRYHDALRAYRQTKLSLAERSQMERDEQEIANALAAGVGGGVNNNDDSMLTLNTVTFPGVSAGLAQQVTRAEMDFCKALCQIVYSAERSNTTTTTTMAASDGSVDQEGHLWNLLAFLRKLGPSALIWHDDSASMMQYESAQSFFLQDLARRIHQTPKEVVDAMVVPLPSTTAGTTATGRSSTTPPPMVLQRKYRLVQWIRSCLEHEKKVSNFVPLSSTGDNQALFSKNHPDAQVAPALLSDLDVKLQKRLLQTCLAHVLQGKLEEAQKLARSVGQPWRAAAWGGGAPDGYESRMDDATQTLERVPTGNPDRFLWKRQIWKAGRTMLEKQQSSQQQPLPPRVSQAQASTVEEEAAIYSILACDVDVALQNPCLRSSWTKSLCVLLSSMWDCIEDKVLHEHNDNRRRNLRPSTFPGSQYEQEENEHMRATGVLAKMTESQLANKLQSSPFLHQQSSSGDGVSYKSTMLSFIVGRSSVVDACSKEADRLLNNVEDSRDWVGLRFLTHLLLFLSSFEVVNSSTALSSLEEYKNQILFKYVEYLVTRPDLWHFLALYVHFLPAKKIMQFYPSVLVRVLDGGERNLMLQQMEEYLPLMTVPILKQVVRLALSADNYGDTDDAATVDEIKCSSLEWLLQHEEHYGDALICANMLLRDFLLDKEQDKMEIASFFMQGLPPNLVEEAGETLPRYLKGEEKECEQADYVDKVNNARREYSAYACYLDAYKVFDEWRETLHEIPTTLEESQGQSQINLSNLNDLERQVAESHSRGTWLKAKREACSNVAAAAEAARDALYKVLTHTGGWLCIDDEDHSKFDPEEETRRQEISDLRSHHLVMIVGLYHQVCEETASWMSRSLDDAGAANLARQEIMDIFDPEVAPSFWYQKALDLATLVAAEQYKISTAFTAVDLQDFLSKLAETAVSKLMNE